MRFLAILLVVLTGVSGCSVPDDLVRPDPLFFEAKALANVRELVVATPGAITSAGILLPLKGWETSRRAVVFYRLPGLDGLPETPRLSFRLAARDIADLVDRVDPERVYFVGHSLGHALNLEAAKELRRRTPDREIQLAGISTALPTPQPVLAGVRGAAGTIAAAARVGSLDRRTVWLEYYRTLLYGRNVENVAVDAARATELVAGRAPHIFVPSRKLGRAHTQALLGWTNPDPNLLANVPIYFFHGSEDPVFPLSAVQRFATRFGLAQVLAYPGDGHLLLITRKTQIYDDIRQVFGF